MTRYPDLSSKDLMSPESITEHKSTVIRRDPTDQEIDKAGKTGAVTPEVREKYRKTGATKLQALSTSLFFTI
jgi:hypothetical protein